MTIFARFTAVMAFFMAFGSTAIAQTSSFKQAIARYKSSSAATASVTMTTHKAAVKKDATATGTMSLKDPDKVCINVNGGKNVLLMNGTDFTMVKGKRKYKTSSKTNAQFTTFQKVFETILSGGANGTDISKLPGVTMQSSDNGVEIDIVPSAGSGKTKRMMFSSFKLGIDAKTSALKYIEMHQRGKNYIRYTFHNFKFDAKVSDSVFRI